MAKSNSGVAVQRREHWRDLLSRWQASGLSQARFCQRRGIPVWKFAWWRKRLGANGVAPSPSFVPVRVVAPPPAGELELTLRSGRVLRFDMSVDAARLAAIVSALEAVASGGSAC